MNRVSPTPSGHTCRFRPALHLLLCLLLACNSLTQARAEKLTLGMFAYRPTAELQAEWEPLVNYLQSGLPNDHTLELRVLDNKALREALLADELDFLFTNPVHYIELRSERELTGALATQVNVLSDIENARLGGVAIRRADRQHPASLQDLPGNSVAILGKQYLGGYATLMGELQRMGVNAGGINFSTTGKTHYDIVQAVLEGDYDVGFVRTGILERMAEEGRIDLTQLSILEPQEHPGFPYASSTRLYPEWPFVALPKVPQQISKRVAALLYNLPTDHPAARAANIQAFTVPADYQPVEALMMQLRLPPFDSTPDFSLVDIWNRHKIAVILGLLLVTTIIGLLIALFFNNQRQRATRRELKQLNLRYRRIIDGTNAGTWEWNVQTDAIVINARWAEMLGYQLAELQPTTIDTWINLTHPDDLRTTQQTLERHLAGEIDHYAIDIRMRHRNGQWIWVRDSGRLMTHTDSGKPEWMFGTHMDVSAQHREREEQDHWLERFRDLSRNIPGTLYQYRLLADGSSQFPFASPGIEAIYGCTPEDVQADSSTVFTRIVPEDVDRVAASIQRSAETLTLWHETYRINHPSLGEIWVEGSASPERQQDGSTLWHGYIHDITELRRAREQLRLAASVFEASLDAIFITDARHQFIHVNLAFKHMTGYTLEELQNMHPGQLIEVADSPELIDRVSDFLATEDSWSHEVTVTRKSGDHFPADITVSTVRDEDGEISHHVAVFSDISARKAHEAELDHIAHFDPLTGIPNRRLLTDRMQQAIAQARRTGERLAVVMLDLDGFKPVNDRWGHEAGDLVLVEIARRLRQLLRTEDTVARLGGDEFVLLLRHVASEKVFYRVLDAIRQPIAVNRGGAEVSVSASIGVAFFDAEAPVDGDQLLRVADQAAYQAKAAGKDCFVVFSENDYAPAGPEISSARGQTAENLR